ncbi:MAG: Holliday junction resolvase RuvX [Magnetovibrio sp.]|nr:Holliday junction resolvase RuvX [Magnetovibrio sp.]|tara:strand:+ start:258 stop:740 length:483 start_codon:yes stop_codon:yes gene_type:complete
MPIVSIKDLKTELKPGQCLLGIDLGSTTIGMAISDTNLIIASPLRTIKRGKFKTDLKELISIIEERDIGGIVIGLPISMNGQEGPRCQATRQFAKNILNIFEFLIAFWDERLSTAAVKRVLIEEADITRKRQSEVIDKVAAAYILQGALDALSGIQLDSV